jgi:hypothetical protein
MLLKSVMKCPGAPLRGSFHAPKVPTKTLVSSVGRVLGRAIPVGALPCLVAPKVRVRLIAASLGNYPVLGDYARVRRVLGRTSRAYVLPSFYCQNVNGKNGAMCVFLSFFI